jgi:hypothetical protein
MGAYSNILPANALRDATASVYAEIAHRLGWLELDRALSAAEFQRLNADVGGWARQDRTLPEVLETFGPPSLWIGGTNRFYPKTLAYTTAHCGDDLICFHLWNAFANSAPEAGLRVFTPNRWCSPYATDRTPFPARSRSRRRACAARRGCPPSTRTAART